MKKQRKIAEDFVPSITTNTDSAVMIRNAIKTCWDNIDTYSMLSQQLSEFGCQFAKSSFDTLINDLYITVGALEEVLNTYDPKAAAIEAPAEITALNTVAPQVVAQMAQPTIIATPVLEKFTLDEGNSLNEGVEEKPEVQKKLEKPVESDLKTVEKYRKEKIKDSQNPDHEELEEELKNSPEGDYFKDQVDGIHQDLDNLAKEAQHAGLTKTKNAAMKAFDVLDDPTLNEANLGEDETLNPRFYESLLKLED